jgi:WD40 repeat protein
MALGCLFTLVLSLGLGPAVAPTPAAAQGTRISLPLPRAPGFAAEDTFAFRASSDGAWVVYLADDEVDDLFELYGVPSDGSAPARKLNGPLVAGGQIVEVQGFPPFVTYGVPYLRTSATRVVYRADQETDGRQELFSAPLDGSTPAVRISGPLASGGYVDEGFVLAQDGASVVFRARLSADDRYELFSVPADGSALPLRLSAPLGLWGEVYSDPPLVTPDGETVVYSAVVPPSQTTRLYAVPVDGSQPPLRLSGPRAVSMALVPDGSGVVYRAWDSVSALWLDLWYVPLDASAAPRRLDARVSSGSVVAFAISSDATRVVYQADHSIYGTFELWSAPLDGSAAPVRLNAPLGSEQSVLTFAFSPDGARVAYVADQDAPGTLELYSVPADGSASPVKLSPTPVPGGGIGGGGQDHYLEVGAERVVWVADAASDDVFELYSAPLDGGAPALRLNAPLPAGADVGGGIDARAFRLSPDGRDVVFWADAFALDQKELLLVPADGSAPAVRLNPPPVYLGGVAPESVWGIEEGFAFTPDGARVLYRADQEIDERFDLWSARLDRPGRARRLDPPLDPGYLAGAVRRFAWASDGEHLVYSNGPSVYALTLDARPEVGPIPFVLLGVGASFELSPQGARVAYQATPGCDYSYCIPSAALWCEPLDGGAPAALLNDGLWGFAERARFTPDGARVVLYENASGWRTVQRGLFVVPSDGSAAPLSLTEPPGMVPAPFEVERHLISPDGLRVVFEQDDAAGPALFSVPIDRSLEPVRLHAPIGYERDVLSGFELTSDSTRAVFVADLTVPGRFQLHVSPLDAATPPVKLLPPLLAGSDVDGALRLTSDDERVLVVADLVADDVFELWSAPLDPVSGGPVLRLSGTGVTGGDVSRGVVRTTGTELDRPLPQFELAPDGTRVVYRADQDTDEVFELWSVPLDASTPPVRLHASLAPDRDVPAFGFRITADSRRVVFVVEDGLGVARLWSAPLDGSAPALELSGPLVAGGGLWHSADGVALSFELSPDGRHVAWLADALTDEVFELFVRPVDGSRPLRRLNRELPPGGDVRPTEIVPAHAPFAFSPDSRYVVYQADQDEDGVHELFVSSVAVLHVRPGQVPPR